jgi:hypothetical protein
MLGKQPPVFWISAILFLGAALFHLYGLLLSGGDPKLVAFHGAFVVIDPLTAFFLLKRPNWLAFAFAVLTVQQIYSHGMDALTAWREDSRVDFVSLIIIVFMPALLALIIYDAVKRKSESP